jgi:hypothetical protein
VFNSAPLFRKKGERDLADVHYTNLTEQKLDGFIVDLYKLIKYEERKQSSLYIDMYLLATDRTDFGSTAPVIPTDRMPTDRMPTDRMLVRHNNFIPIGNFHKDWQRYVKTWFNQPAQKIQRRQNLITKAAKVCTNPIYPSSLI